MLNTLYAVVKIFAKNIKKSKYGKTKIMIYTIQTQSINSETYTVSLDELISNVLQQEYVIGARAFEWDGTIVVATLTTPFILKSDRDNAKTQIFEDLQNAFPEQDIVITFDMQVYRNIADELDDSVKQKLLELAKSR